MKFLLLIIFNNNFNIKKYKFIYFFIKKNINKKYYRLHLVKLNILI